MYNIQGIFETICSRVGFYSMLKFGYNSKDVKVNKLSDDVIKLQISVDGEIPDSVKPPEILYIANSTQIGIANPLGGIYSNSQKSLTFSFVMSASVVESISMSIYAPNQLSLVMFNGPEHYVHFCKDGMVYNDKYYARDSEFVQESRLVGGIDFLLLFELKDFYEDLNVRSDIDGKPKCDKQQREHY